MTMRERRGNASIIFAVGGDLQEATVRIYIKHPHVINNAVTDIGPPPPNMSTLGKSNSNQLNQLIFNFKEYFKEIHSIVIHSVRIW